ncbi:TolC family protein [Mucilaginibacter sp. R-33]|uniref:TolC family protein n=1 Tax=Mucilaginibacter sp. R-33 TaxID=3416711 RepID=UPI003CED8EB4
MAELWSDGSCSCTGKSAAISEASGSSWVGRQSADQVSTDRCAESKIWFKEAQSYLYPQVGITVEYVRNIKPAVFFLPVFSINSASQIVFDDKQLQAIPASSKNAYNGNVNVSMPLFNQEISGNVKTAHLDESLNNANLELSRWELADEIRKAYFNILIARQNQVLTDASLKRSERNLNDSRQLFVKGYANKSDTLGAWSNVELMKINCSKVGTAVKQSGNYLKSLLNLPLDKDLELTDSIGVQLVGEQQNLINDTLKANNLKRPDFRANDWKTQIAQQQVKNEQSKYLPSLAFVGQYTLQAQSDNFNFARYNVPNSFYVDVQLSIPIFTGFRTDARVKQSKLALEQAITARSVLENQANLQVSNNRLAITESTEKIKGQKNIQYAREQALAFIKARWQKGFAKYTDVADAELQMVQADNDYTQSVFEYLAAVAGYYKATGNIL